MAAEWDALAVAHCLVRAPRRPAAASQLKAARCASCDDNHAATATRAWRAMVCCGAGGWVRLVALHRRIGHRHGHGDQFSGTRDILLAGGAGEQAVVAGGGGALLEGE